MKIYNIRDSREFFEKLSTCKGKVKLVNENGTQMELTPGTADLNAFPLVYFRGTIREMEVIFQDAEDWRNIVSYLMNMKNKMTA